MGPSTGDNKCKQSPDEGLATVADWLSQTDLSHIECIQMRTRLFDMLASHAGM